MNNQGKGLDDALFKVGGVILGVFAAIGLVFWLTGELAGIVFRFDRPGTSIAAIGTIVINFVQNLGDPKMAWPEAQQAALPGPIPFYFTFLGVVAGIIGLIFAGKQLWDRVFDPKDTNVTKWAKTRDLRTMTVSGPSPGRLVMGRANGKLIATEARQSVIVLGPTQTGKTTGLAIPAILEWEGPVVAASVKNDLVRDTYKWRRRHGDVWLFDPTRSTGFEYDEVRAGWSPLSAAVDWGGARKVASWLCKAAKSENNNLQDSDFWYSAAEKLMAPYLFAASRGKRSMGDVLKWIDAMEEAEVMGILARAGVEEAALAFAANMRRDERARSSIYTTAETILDAYGDPLVAESATNPRIFPQEMLNGGSNTLYICAPSHEQDRLRPIFTAMVNQMLAAAYELAGKQNKPIDPAMLIVIDEAANIAPLKDLDALASTAAGVGVQLVTVFQDMAQIEARYGTRSRTVVNNHRAKIVLSGISDPTTLEYVTKICGEEEISKSSVTHGGQGDKSTTESKDVRSIASAGFLRRMRPGEGLAVYGHLSPAKIVLRPWFKDKKLRSRAEQGVDVEATTKPALPGRKKALPAPRKKVGVK